MSKSLDHLVLPVGGLFETLTPANDVVVPTDIAELTLGKAGLVAMTRDLFRDRFGCTPQANPASLHLRAIVFASTELAQLERQLASHNVRFDRYDDSIVVPPEEGQGAVFAFEPA